MSLSVFVCAVAVLGIGPPATPVERRAADWRFGPIVYQIFVDRFAPPKDPTAKAKFFQQPRSFRPWSELPKMGRPLPDLGVWSHELEFWGGDLAGIHSRLDYIQSLGADAVYLTPIQKAFTNHKYDAIDYNKIAPEFGDETDLRALAAGLRQRNMRLVLDGVFNHMGRRSPFFEEALRSEQSARRNWYFFGPQYARGYRTWFGVGNLVSNRLEEPAFQRFLWSGRDSVVKRYLRMGVDGWRLDVAFELGSDAMIGIRRAAHSVKRDALIVGEINGYPSDWNHELDGVYNFAAMTVVAEMLNGSISGGRGTRMLGDMVEDAGIDFALRSWLHIDNHDVPRVATMMPDAAMRNLWVAMKFLLPGSPVVYYGTELGMTGEGDPANRAPMRWDLVNDDNTTLAFYRKLIRMRQSLPALRYGDFTPLQSDRLLAFTRTTGNVREAVLVVANPTDQEVTESLMTRVGRWMSWGELSDAWSGQKVRSITGLLRVTVPPRSFRVFSAYVDRQFGYSPYDRIP